MPPRPRVRARRGDGLVRVEAAAAAVRPSSSPGAATAAAFSSSARVIPPPLASDSSINVPFVSMPPPPKGFHGVMPCLCGGLRDDDRGRACPARASTPWPAQIISQRVSFPGRPVPQLPGNQVKSPAAGFCGTLPRSGSTQAANPGAADRYLPVAAPPHADAHPRSPAGGVSGPRALAAGRRQRGMPPARHLPELMPSTRAEWSSAQADRQVAATILEYFAELYVPRRNYGASADRTHRARAEAARSVARCADEQRGALP